MRRLQVVIDAMAVADVADVVELEALAFPPRPEAHGESGRVGESQLREELARPWARLWVARGGARGEQVRVVAFLLAWHVADELHVLNVATHPDHRRRGVARAMMEHALDFARANKGRLILLEVRRSNSGAIALYRALGFFAMGLRRRYYNDGEDAIEMALLMDPATGTIQPHPDEVRID